MLAAAGLMAGGCATRAPHAAMDAGIAVPPSWSLQAPSGTAPLARWWRAFGDARLVALVEASVQANTDARIAQANLRQARALRDEAAALAWPDVAVSVSAQRRRTAQVPSGNLFQAGFDAGWEPDLFGATGHAIAAAQAQVEAGTASLASTLVSVEAEAATGYLQLRGAQARVAVARGNLAAQEQTLQIASWREQAGLGSSLDVAQARSAVEQTRAQLPLLDGAIAQTEHALAVLTGQPPAALHAELSAAAPLPRPPQDLTLAIPADVLRRRPDVLAAEQQLRAAAEGVAQADAARRPSVQIQASLAWSAATLGSLGSVSAARSLLAGASQTLFDHGRRDAQLAVQQAAFDVAQETYRARVLAALQEVEDALAALDTGRHRVAALSQAVEASRDASLLATYRYAGGLVDFQTVLDTQRTLLGVQDGAASAETDLAVAHVRLYKALGGGWSPVGAASSSVPGEAGS